MKRTAGLTMPEILVVTAILIFLGTTLWFVLGPSVKAKRWEMRVKNDLRQILVATHQYTADNDGEYPINIWSFAPHVPKGIEEFPETSPLRAGTSGHAKYFFVYGLAQRNRYECHPLAERFDESRHAIVKASFFGKIVGEYQRPFYSLPGHPPKYITSKDHKVLGIRLDGALGWHRDMDTWQMEWLTVGGSPCPE
jgi:hypothetical protein